MKLLQKFRCLSWKTWLKIALCLCAVVAIGLFARQMLRPGPGTVEVKKNGLVVHMPIIPNNNNCEVPGYFYSSTAFYFEAFDSLLPSELVGEKIGVSDFPDAAQLSQSGMISFTGSFLGDIHTVEGYSPEFMLCCPQYGRIFLRTGGFSAKYGSDIIQDGLHLPGQYAEVYVGTQYPKYYGTDFGVRLEDHANVDQLLAEVCAAELLPAKSRDSLGYLYFHKTDGIKTTLRLYEGGYVECFGIDRVCVHIPGEAFDAIVSLLK